MVFQALAVKVVIIIVKHIKHRNCDKGKFDGFLSSDCLPIAD